MIAALAAIVLLAAYPSHTRAKLSAVRQELTAVKYNVKYYCDLYYSLSRTRTAESVRREGPVAHCTIDSLTQCRSDRWRLAHSKRRVSRGICEATGKLAFATPQAAERRRKELKRSRDDRLSTYRCARCGRWHLGHSDKFPKPPRR